MRVLVTGANGQLGSELVRLYNARSGDEVLGIDLPDLDITSTESVAHTVSEFKPDVVINCAAWTAVDAAEENESAALLVNGEGPETLAAACRVTGAWLVQLSTDYVFSGEASSPYAEDATPDPRSAYGRTKLAGEEAVQSMLPDAHYIVRTAWLYGTTVTTSSRPCCSWNPNTRPWMWSMTRSASPLTRRTSRRRSSRWWTLVRRPGSSMARTPVRCPGTGSPKRSSN